LTLLAKKIQSSRLRRLKTRASVWLLRSYLFTTATDYCVEVATCFSLNLLWTWKLTKKLEADTNYSFYSFNFYWKGVVLVVKSSKLKRLWDKIYGSDGDEFGKAGKRNIGALNPFRFNPYK